MAPDRKEQIAVELRFMRHYSSLEDYSAGIWLPAGYVVKVCEISTIKVLPSTMATSEPCPAEPERLIGSRLRCNTSWNHFVLILAPFSYLIATLTGCWLMTDGMVLWLVMEHIWWCAFFKCQTDFPTNRYESESSLSVTDDFFFVVVGRSFELQRLFCATLIFIYVHFF